MDSEIKELDSQLTINDTIYNINAKHAESADEVIGKVADAAYADDARLAEEAKSANSLKSLKWSHNADFLKIFDADKDLRIVYDENGSEGIENFLSHANEKNKNERYFFISCDKSLPIEEREYSCFFVELNYNNNKYEIKQIPIRCDYANEATSAKIAFMAEKAETATRATQADSANTANTANTARTAERSERSEHSYKTVAITPQTAEQLREVLGQGWAQYWTSLDFEQMKQRLLILDQQIVLLNTILFGATAAGKFLESMWGENLYQKSQDVLNTLIAATEEFPDSGAISLPTSWPD